MIKLNRSVIKIVIWVFIPCSIILFVYPTTANISPKKAKHNPKLFHSPLIKPNGYRLAASCNAYRWNVGAQLNKQANLSSSQRANEAFVRPSPAHTCWTQRWQQGNGIPGARHQVNVGRQFATDYCNLSEGGDRHIYHMRESAAIVKCFCFKTEPQTQRIINRLKNLVYRLRIYKGGGTLNANKFIAFRTLSPKFRLKSCVKSRHRPRLDTNGVFGMLNDFDGENTQPRKKREEYWGICFVYQECSATWNSVNFYFNSALFELVWSFCPCFIMLLDFQLRATVESLRRCIMYLGH